MDEHDLRNLCLCHFLLSMKIMSVLSVQGSNDQFCFSPKNKNAGKIRAQTSKLELGVAALIFKFQFRLQKKFGKMDIAEGTNNLIASV